MKRKITLIAAGALLWLNGAKAQMPCSNDLNGFVSYKNVAGTGSYQLKLGFEEKAAQTYFYSGPGKISSVRVYGNYPTPGFGGVPLKVGVYNVDASGKPTTALATVNETWWGFSDNSNGYINVYFPNGVVVNNRFAITVEVRNAFPYGDVFNLRYTGNGEGGGQDLASLAGTSTGNNWASAKVSFNKDGDFYLVPNMAHLNVPQFTTGSSCYAINSPVSFNNTSQFTKDSMFNKIGFPNYSGSNFLYTWNFGDNSAVDHSMNPSHTYTAGGVYTTSLTTTIEGWNGVCTKTYTRSVSVGLLVNATSVTSVTCFGGNNGSFVASGQFGAPNYQYNINGGSWQSGTGFTGLTAGVYTLNIKDIKNCSNSSIVTIIEPIGISVNNVITTNSSCGNATGGISCSATGGVAPLQYKLDNGGFQSTGSFTGIMAGTHTVLVQDANGCTTSALITVNDAGGPVFGTPNVINVSCANGNDGSITLTSTGGTGLIQYSINGGNTFQTSGVFNNVGAGTYACVVKDNAGCTDNVILTVTQGPALTISANSSPALCNGGSNGQITAASAGGTGSHNYSINGNIYQSTPTFFGLSAGVYTVYVKDVTSCIKTTTVAVSEPSVVSHTLTASPVTCNSFSNGSITVSASGGNGGYMYSIDGVNFQGVGSFANLSAGLYTVTTKDVNNCMNVTSIGIVQPSAITTTVNTTNSTCSFTNGAILVLASGGSGPGYQFSIDGGANFNTSGSFSPLPAGTQYIIVKDNSGCQTIVAATIMDSNGPAITNSSQQNISCNGGSDGVISVITVTGGTGQLQYSKNGINWQLSPVFNGLQAGAYVIQVKDANGCTGVVTKTLTQPNPFLIVPSTSSVLCAGNATGSATITASGGAGFLVYSINGGNSYQSSTVFGSLAAGQYTVIVKDAAGCTGNSVFSVIQSQPIGTNLGVLNVKCHGANTGIISVSASGGVGPYLYALNTPIYSSVNTFTALFGNTIYTIFVKDANNCVIATSTIVTEPSALTVIPMINNVNCAGGNNGAINLNVSGGVSPYKYLWSNGGNSSAIFNLIAGVYNVTVKDFNGCLASSSHTITQPSNALVVNAVVVSASGNSSGDGNIDITVNGGNGPYTFNWSNGATTEDISGLNPGAYMVTVTDANGCTTTSTFNVGNATGLSNAQMISSEIRMFPNPAREYTTVDANGLRISKIQLVNILGQAVYEKEVDSSVSKINTSEMMNGVYFVKIYVNNTVITKKLNIAK